jgi:hypothetical protein|tara:strand:- start:4982 stop:5254 length:273 start_codon:yes stop_codon:yes gene_type:complete
MKHLEVGRKAKYDGLEGTIEFVSDDYITICVSTKPNPEGSRQPMNKCCICVYPNEWGNVEVEAIKQYGKSYKGKIDDHPGNDMLPEVDKR